MNPLGLSYIYTTLHVLRTQKKKNLFKIKAKHVNLRRIGISFINCSKVNCIITFNNLLLNTKNNIYRETSSFKCYKIYLLILSTKNYVFTVYSS